MKRYLRIPDDMPLLNPATGEPMWQGDPEKSNEPLFEKGKDGQPTKGPDGQPVRVRATASFAQGARALFLDPDVQKALDSVTMLELLAKLTQPPGAVVELDDETELAPLIPILKRPTRERMTPNGPQMTSVFAATFLFSALPFFKAFLDAATTKPAEA